MNEYLSKRVMKENAERICALADAFGHLPCSDGDKRSIEELLNLSIPCARLIKAGIVTQVVDSFDSVNDQAVQDVEIYCHLAIRRLTQDHGSGWWTEEAERLQLRSAANVRVIEDEVVAEPVAPKAKKGFRQAGPLPDGSYIERRTDNDYSHAVAVIDESEEVWAAGKGYHANPNLGKYVSFSWNGRYDLAVKSAEKARKLGYTAVIIPVLPQV